MTETATIGRVTQVPKEPIVHKPLTFGSLFAGIGGFDLGFERAGMECRWQVEIDPYCQRVLAKHWPGVRRHDDVRTWPRPDTERVEVIVGGFPCQDVSRAGLGAGLSGERSGLFYELLRVVREVGPKVVVLENVAALLTRGMDEVLRQLAAVGFDAEWCCIPASGIGAPHVRDRVFVVAYANGLLGRSRFRVFDADHWQGPLSQEQYRERAEALGWDMASAPRLGRVDDGIPFGVERRRGIGNAVVPQVAEWIGRRLMELVL